MTSNYWPISTPSPVISERKPITLSSYLSEKSSSLWAFKSALICAYICVCAQEISLNQSRLWTLSGEGLNPEAKIAITRPNAHSPTCQIHTFKLRSYEKVRVGVRCSTHLSRVPFSHMLHGRENDIACRARANGYGCRRSHGCPWSLWLWRLMFIQFRVQCTGFSRGYETTLAPSNYRLRVVGSNPDVSGGRRSGYGGGRGIWPPCDRELHLFDLFSCLTYSSWKN